MPTARVRNLLHGDDDLNAHSRKRPRARPAPVPTRIRSDREFPLVFE
jgi:hypothetical protein